MPSKNDPSYFRKYLSKKYFSVSKVYKSGELWRIFLTDDTGKRSSVKRKRFEDAEDCRKQLAALLVPRVKKPRGVHRKLSVENILFIRANRHLYASRELAKMFNVGKQTVLNVLSERTYRGVGQKKVPFSRRQKISYFVCDEEDYDKLCGKRWVEYHAKGLPPYIVDYKTKLRLTTYLFSHAVERISGNRYDFRKFNFSKKLGSKVAKTGRLRIISRKRNGKICRYFIVKVVYGKSFVFSFLKGELPAAKRMASKIARMNRDVFLKFHKDYTERRRLQRAKTEFYDVHDKTQGIDAQSLAQMTHKWSVEK